MSDADALAFTHPKCDNIDGETGLWHKSLRQQSHRCAEQVSVSGPMLFPDQHMWWPMPPIPFDCQRYSESNICIRRSVPSPLATPNRIPLRECLRHNTQHGQAHARRLWGPIGMDGMQLCTGARANQRCTHPRRCPPRMPTLSHRRRRRRIPPK